jgi:hypothetical protein
MLPNRPIYLDNHATTPVDPRVLAAMRPWWEQNFANPGSVEHALGRERLVDLLFRAEPANRSGCRRARRGCFVDPCAALVTINTRRAQINQTRRCCLDMRCAWTI